jgi:hypothetical protein
MGWVAGLMGGWMYGQMGKYRRIIGWMDNWICSYTNTHAQTETLHTLTCTPLTHTETHTHKFHQKAIV